MQEHEIENRILQLLGTPGVPPQKPHALMRALNVPPALRRAVRHALRELESSGQITLLRGNRYGIVDRGPRFTGTLSMHHNGFGFVLVDDGQEEKPDDDIFIPPGQVGIARHQDRVEVELLDPKHRSKRDKGPEGRIIRVIERTTSKIVGTLQKTYGSWQLVPDDPRYTEVIHIHDPAAGAMPKEHHKYVAYLNDRSNPDMVETATLIEELGHIDDAEVDILSIMRTHGLAQEFPDRVEREAKSFHSGIPDEEYETRRDLTDWFCCTIDPDDARDFDDALTWEALPDGGQRLAVHIADVAHFVKPGTAIDEEAQLRGNSAYLVDRVVSMLPSNLTTDLCSLVPNQNRMAHTVIIDFNRNLKVTNCESCHSIIHSRARFTYKEVQAWMDDGELGHVPENAQETLHGLRHLALALRKQRFKNLALTFNVPEIRCILDEENKVIGFDKREGMEAYQLVEECMLVANREVGAMLAARFKHAMYRIHEEPPEKNWETMAADLRKLGLGDIPVSRSTLNQIVTPDLPEALKLPATIAILKNLNRAEYATDVGEHYGLAFTTYTHFTSPIRRYPDLVAHRLLDALAENNESPYSVDELRHIAQHCSRTERNAEEAEKATVSVRRLQYYHERLWNGHPGPFPAMVTGVSPKGLLVELIESSQRGLVPFHTFGDDYYTIDSEATSARGKRSNRIFRVGDELNVLLARVDVPRRMVDLIPDEGSYRERRMRQSKQKKPSGKRNKRRKGEVKQAKQP